MKTTLDKIAVRVARQTPPITAAGALGTTTLTLIPIPRWRAYLTDSTMRAVHWTDMTGTLEKEKGSGPIGLVSLNEGHSIPVTSASEAPGTLAARMVSQWTELRRV